MATAEDKAVEETEKVVARGAVAGHAAAHGGGWAIGASGVAFERVEEVETAVAVWAGTATAAATAAVRAAERARAAAMGTSAANMAAVTVSGWAAERAVTKVA